MNKKEFQEIAKKRILYLDGATGSNLQKRGMPNGVCPEQWICEHPEVLLGLQKEYIEAGSDIIYAPTFSANPIKLKEYGLEKEVERLNRELVAISKKAAAQKALVAGDITMTGQQMAPLGTLEFEEVVQAYKEQIAVLADAGVDLLVIETMMSLNETRAALIAAKEVCDLAVMVTMTFDESGKTLYGTDAQTAVNVLQSLGAAAVGVNCSAGPDKMLPIVETMKKYASVPLIAKPNAGLPVLLADGTTGYDMNAEDFATHMQKLIVAGADIVGGCCGTTPEFIEKMKAATQDLQPASWLFKQPLLAASERICLEFTEDIRIGTAINPECDEDYKQELMDDEYDTVLDLTDEQIDDGAQMIQICVDMEGIDTEHAVKEVTGAVSSCTGQPLVFATDSASTLEAALRNYCGRAVVRIKKEDETLKKVAEKYGAICMFGY